MQDADGGIGNQSDTVRFIRDPLGDCANRRSLGSSSVRSVAGVDCVEEDFNRDKTARATGFLESSSEISQLQKSYKEDHENKEPTAAGQLSPPRTPGGDADLTIASLDYYVNSPDMQFPDVQPHQVPSPDVTGRLWQAYFEFVHPMFPIIEMSSFNSEYQHFITTSAARPEKNKNRLAILNLILAIAAVKSHPVDHNWQLCEDDHLNFYVQARKFNAKIPRKRHPDLEQIQIDGLTGFYLFATGQINWYDTKLDVLYQGLNLY